MLKPLTRYEVLIRARNKKVERGIRLTKGDRPPDLDKLYKQKNKQYELESRK